jgi:hypothetical protein
VSLAIVILGAIITPTPGAFNLMLFDAPMCVLFFLGIFLSYLLVLKRENRSVDRVPQVAGYRRGIDRGGVPDRRPLPSGLALAVRRQVAADFSSASGSRRM